MVRMVSRLAAKIPLDPADIRFLESTTGRPVRFRRRELIQQSGELADSAFFLESGWAMTFSDFPDGSRQSRRMHFPGDILGLPSMATRHHSTSVEAITDVVAIPFGKAMIADLLGKHPRLAAIMFIFAQEERITLGDRMCSLSRLPCKGRLAFLLIDVLTRVRASDPDVRTTFENHLTRAAMAEITGMSPVHASRVWCELIDEGLIAADGPFVTVLDEQRLAELSNFVDRSLDLDFGWLPDPADHGAASVPRRLLQPS